MRTSVLFGAKTLDFSKFMVCPHGQEVRGIEPVRTFCGQGGGGQFIAILCGRLLWITPYEKMHSLYPNSPIYIPTLPGQID